MLSYRQQGAGGKGSRRANGELRKGTVDITKSLLKVQCMQLKEKRAEIRECGGRLRREEKTISHGFEEENWIFRVAGGDITRRDTVE